MSRADLAAQLRLISQSTDFADVPDEFLCVLQAAAKALEGDPLASMPNAYTIRLSDDGTGELEVEQFGTGDTESASHGIGKFLVSELSRACAEAGGIEIRGDA